MGSASDYGAPEPSRWPLTLRETVLLAVLVVEVMWSRGVLA